MWRGSREVLNGICSVTREGIGWRAMPHDLPYFGVCSWYLRRFQKDGTWEVTKDAVRKALRVATGREPEPSVAIIDCQSVKTTEQRGLSAAMTSVKGNGAEAVHPRRYDGTADASPPFREDAFRSEPGKS